MSRIKDITNQRFGKLVAVKPTNKRNNGNVVWECKCDCGNTIFVRSDSLVRHEVCSCGCYKRNILDRKLQKDNSSGVTGVSYDKKNRTWRSYIYYNNHLYHLLCDKDISNCIAIRKEAEDAVRDGNFEEWIANYKGRMTV